MEKLTDEYIFALDKDYESYAECKEKGYSEAFSREQDLKRQLKAKDKTLDKEEQYKLALFLVVRNSIVMRKGLALGKTMKEINQMSIDACREVMDLINFEVARKEYENGID